MSEALLSCLPSLEDVCSRFSVDGGFPPCEENILCNLEVIVCFGGARLEDAAETVLPRDCGVKVSIDGGRAVPGCNSGDVAAEAPAERVGTGDRSCGE